MSFKRIFTDPSFWALLAVNIYSVYYYFMHPGIFTTLIWLYWCQSMMLGVFNFFDILTLGSDKKEGAIKDSKTIIFGNTYVAFFFLFHYGFFHLGYFIFLSKLKISGPFDHEFFRMFLLFFLGSQIINFVQHKIQFRKTKPSINIFLLPYVRIIPMHLCMLLPAFFGWGNLQAFVILKVIADMGTYVITSSYYKKDKTQFINSVE